MLVSFLSKDFLFKNNWYTDEKVDSIGSDDAIIFLNPISCTVDQKDRNYLDHVQSAFLEESVEEPS